MTELTLDESLALHEEAKRLIRVLRQKVASLPPLSEGSYSLSTFETFLNDAERGGIAWKISTSDLPLDQADRRQSMVTGPFYFNAEYPLPAERDGKLMLPCIQADLRELSKLRGLPLGDGLLQAFSVFDDWVCRVIPRDIVDSVEPLPFPTDCTEFNSDLNYSLESWMKRGRGVTVIDGYCLPHIHFDTREDEGMWEWMIAERTDRAGMDVEEDEELEAVVLTPKNEMTEEELEETPQPAELTRLLEILELLSNARPGGDQVFGAFHGIHSRPYELDYDCLFAFEGDFFNFSGAGNSHILYGFENGEPNFYFTIASCR